MFCRKRGGGRRILGMNLDGRCWRCRGRGKDWSQEKWAAKNLVLGWREKDLFYVILYANFLKITSNTIWK